MFKVKKQVAKWYKIADELNMSKKQQNYMESAFNLY